MSANATPGRRVFLRTGAALGAVGTLAAVTATPTQAATGAATTAAPVRKPVLVGSNPGIQLFDAAGACTAYASIWRVDWSTHGSGEALVLWTPRGVTVASKDTRLARWLWEDYTSLFPELEGLPTPAPHFLRQQVHIDLDLASGLVARAGSVTVRLARVLDHRWVDVPEFTLGDRSESLNFAFAPCGQGTITVAGHRLPGQIEVGGTPERPSTSAFLSEAEVWRG